MASTLRNAAMITNTSMTGPEGSSSMYRDWICSAVRRLIQRKIMSRKTVTAPSQVMRRRVMNVHLVGRQKKQTIPAVSAIQNLKC